MKIVISEQQLQRIIKEFYGKPKVMNLGRGRTIIDITISELQQYLAKFDKTVNGEEIIQDYAEFINERIIGLFKEKYIQFDNEVIENIVKENLATVEGKKIIMQYPKKLVVFWYDNKRTYTDFEKLKEAINFTSEKVEKYVNEILTDDTYNLAPTYSGQEINDNLQKRIYDWEYTKTIIEKLFHYYINSESTESDIFKVFSQKPYLDDMLMIMDKDMENNEYNLFPRIRQNKLTRDFETFFGSFVEYYGKKHNNTNKFYSRLDVNDVSNLPLEILIGQLFNYIHHELMGKNIKEYSHKKYYDWENTKKFLKEKYLEYLNIPYINRTLSEKLNEKNYIGNIISIMDEIMKQNDYTTFYTLNERSARTDVKHFIDSYINYFTKTKYPYPSHFKESPNPKKKLPLEIFMGRIFYDIYSYLKE
jgi:hypothetical protein